jgi:hypothetical protein
MKRRRKLILLKKKKQIYFEIATIKPHRHHQQQQQKQQRFNTHDFEKKYSKIIGNNARTLDFCLPHSLARPRSNPLVYCCRHIFFFLNIIIVAVGFGATATERSA